MNPISFQEDKLFGGLLNEIPVEMPQVVIATEDTPILDGYNKSNRRAEMERFDSLADELRDLHKRYKSRRDGKYLQVMLDSLIVYLHYSEEEITPNMQRFLDDYRNTKN